MLEWHVADFETSLDIPQQNGRIASNGSWLSRFLVRVMPTTLGQSPEFYPWTFHVFASLQACFLFYWAEDASGYAYLS